MKAGLARVQFETIHPFLDGNGRVGRLPIPLLVEHWKLLSSPLLYSSLAFKRHRQEYSERLNTVRTKGDWEGWTAFFLECARESAGDGVATARMLFSVASEGRRRVSEHKAATVTSVRWFDRLPTRPVITLPVAQKIPKTSKPAVAKAIDALRKAAVLRETTGRRRDRVSACQAYLDVLARGTGIDRA